jgi:hypothetical protein
LILNYKGTPSVLPVTDYEELHFFILVRFNGYGPCLVALPLSLRSEVLADCI